MNLKLFLEKTSEYIFAFTMFFAFAGLYASSKGHSYLSILVVTSISLGIINRIFNKEREPHSNGTTNKLTIIFLIYGATLVINRLLHGEDSSIIRISIFLAVFAYLVPMTVIVRRLSIYGVITSGFIFGILTFNSLSNGIERVGGYTNEILFAQGCLVLTILNAYIFSDKDNSLFIRCGASVGGLGSLYGLLFSQSRGAWLSIIVVVFLCAMLNYKKIFSIINKKILAVGFLVSVTLALLVITIVPSDNILIKRVDAVAGDYQQMKVGNYQTSIGLRFVVWKSAWLGFIENPIFGVGKNGLNDLKKEQVTLGKVNPVLLVGDGGYGMPHAHNQYLNHLVLRGAVGFISLMLLLSTPCFMSEKGKYIGVLITAAYIVSGFTDVPLDQKEPYYLFLFSLLFCIIYSDCIKKAS
ncbi:O-antigen ligase family protein [Aeromonas jandaei]|nr:O-antigen polymerase [Aeromonas veronii]